MLQGTIRTNDKGKRTAGAPDEAGGRGRQLFWSKRRNRDVLRGPPTDLGDPALTDEMRAGIREPPVPGLSLYPGASANASEDFALIAERAVCLFYLGSDT